MTIAIQKGSSFSGYYTSPDMGVFTDWEGELLVYTNYPAGAPVIAKTLTFDALLSRLSFTIDIQELGSLDTGLLYLESTVHSVTAGISVSKLDYVTLTAAAVLTGQPMTILTMTIAKTDGTPAGKETHVLTNTVTGTTIVLGWDGVQVTASHPVADNVSGAIIGVETVTTKTNAAGYAQLSVIKGQSVTVSCQSFGKSVIVDTTGLDTIDLSTFF